MSGKRFRETPKKENNNETKIAPSQTQQRKKPKLKSHQTILNEIQRILNQNIEEEEEEQQEQEQEQQEHQQQQQMPKEPIFLSNISTTGAGGGSASGIGDSDHYTEIKKKKFGSTFSLKHTPEEKLRKEREKREKKAQKEQKHLEKKRY
jgi:hypothetical protein